MNKKVITNKWNGNSQMKKQVVLLLSYSFNFWQSSVTTLNQKEEKDTLKIY